MTFWWRKVLFMPKNVTQEHFDAEMSNLRSEVSELKQEFVIFRSDNAARQDEMVKILKDLQQERVFSVAWVRRIENDVERMKRHLNLI